MQDDHYRKVCDSVEAVPSAVLIRSTRPHRYEPVQDVPPDVDSCESSKNHVTRSVCMSLIVFRY